MRSGHPSITSKLQHEMDNWRGKMTKAELDHLENTCRTSLDVHGERKAGEDLHQPGLEELAHFAIAWTVPHGQGEPLLEISAMDLGRVREASKDLWPWLRTWQ